MASNKPTSSVHDWLESLDLGHFANHFLVNGLTELHHVCNLTEDELGILGITQRGYQKRILNHLPTEAEAFLSEFVSSSDSRAKAPVAEPPPPMPPPRSFVKQYGKENGHPVEKKLNIDDETYLLHGPTCTGHVDPTANIPMLPPRRSLTECQSSPAFSEDSEPIPFLPPRSSDKRVTVASEIPSKQLRVRPTPQPRARSDPSIASKPPPLPGRDEKPVPRQRLTCEVPPRVGHSRPASALPVPDLSQLSFVLNDYEEDLSTSHLLAPPPILSENALNDGNFPNMPPPSSKHLPGSIVPLPSVKGSLPEVPNQDQRSSPLPHPATTPSQQTCFKDTFSPNSSTPQTSDEGALPPPKSSFLSPPPVLPFHDASTLGGSEDGSIPIFSPPAHPTTAPIPIIPPRPPPSIPDPSPPDLPPPSLPPKETAVQRQASPLGGIEDGSTPILPPRHFQTTSTMPVVPPRPSSIPDSSVSDLLPLLPPKETAVHHQTSPLGSTEEGSTPFRPSPSPPTTSVPAIPPRPSSSIPDSSVSDQLPLLPPKETAVHHQASPLGSTEEGSTPFRPSPSPPTTSVPVIPPRPSSSIPEPSTCTSDLPPPLPPPKHLDSYQLFETDHVNPLNSTKDGFDPFEFDPFANPDGTVDVYTVEPPLRPPSLFCNPEDKHESLQLPSILPQPPPRSVVPPQRGFLAPSPPSRAAPSLTTVLMSRPVPLHPGASCGDQQTTLTSCVLPSQPPVPLDNIHSPSVSLQDYNLPQDSTELNDMIDEYLSLQSGETVVPGQTRHNLTENAVLTQTGARLSQSDSGNPPSLAVRSSVGTGQINSGIPDFSTRLDNTLSDPPLPAILPHKTSNFIGLSSEDSNVIKFETVADKNEEKTLLDIDFLDKPMLSTLSPPPVLDLHDSEDQYSKVHRSPKTTPYVMNQAVEKIPEIPARPPRIPPRLDIQGEAVEAPIAPDDDYNHLSQAESQPMSWSNLHVPTSPSALSEGSDRHSYILLSESVSGPHDISDEKIWFDDHPSMPLMPLSSSTFDKTSERNLSSVEDALSASQLPQRPVRRAPPPPLAKRNEMSPPKLPSRPALPKREFVPQLPQNRKEEEYDVLDPKGMVTTSPLRDELLQSPDRIIFKELAQSEESGDDEDSGFDMDILDYSKAAPKQVSDIHVDVDLADRRSRIDLGHIMRIGKAWHPEAAPSPLVRTHSRAVDEKTRKRLSKKLSQSLQDRNSTAEVPAKVTVLKKKGYLWKQGGKQNNKGFRKRWMDFDGNEMRYYENEKTLSECKGIIPVGTMRDVKNLCGTSKLSFGDTKQNRITLETTGRPFHFAAETLDEGTLWANVLMQAILSYKPPPGGFPVGGDMSCPDKKGYVKIEGYHQKRFLAIKGEKLCMHNTEMDFESAIAISDIQMKLASVKELSKNKIQLATPGKIYMLTVENPQDVKEWIEAMKEAIQEGLSDHSILEKVQQNSSNKYCADCRMKDPDWASINLGISICKNCSGLHRNLGVHLSKVRSLKMDTKVWTSPMIQVMLDFGNDKSNAFWEANLNESEKAVPDDTLERRQVYILNKYKTRKYLKAGLSTDKSMDKTVIKAASLGNLDECMQLVFSGANLSYTREDGKTALDVAKECKFSAVAEFLSQNTGILISPLRNDAVPKAVSRSASSMKPAARESKQESIHKMGYLNKTGNNKKEFQKRYCTLEHGIFTYFEDKNQPAKNTIEGTDMVLIAAAEPKQGQKYCFEIYTSIGRTYLMSAETEEERKEWMIVLAKIHSLECMWECLEDFEQAGFLHKKEGAAATNWQRLWFILKGKSLVSFSSTNDELEEIDLRKVISLSRQDSDTIGATDYNHTLSIVLPGKNIYLRAETKQAADCWYEAVNKVTSQGGQALEDQLLTGENVPIIVSQCINFVATHEGIMTEGIYRLSGTSSLIRRIVMSFMEDPRTARLKDEYSVHDVTGALKKFFRELPDPLLTTRLYKKWTEVASYQDHTIRLQWYQHLLGELPPVNYDTLKMLIGHLKNVADNSDFNKMYIRNLAAVFGPTLMASQDSSFVHAEREIAVIADLLTYYAWLYGVTDEQMAKEREKELKYQEGLSKMKAAQMSENSAEQLILMEIFMGKREQGNSINIKISMDHTAAQIIKLALEQQKMIDDGSWALFEIIVKGELERLIHGYERVLPQVLSWNQQMAANNYICIKHNELMERIEPFMEQASLSDLVKFSESKKTFKKYSFELMNNVITCYKEKSTTPANSWKVADMKIYFGVEKKRSPPTQWGISFTINNEEGMKAMCLDNEASYLFWSAGLLKSKVVDPTSLTYSPHALSFRAEHESSFVRYSRNLPKELSNITSKMSFWRKSRLNSVDES